jgi:hypothetical protein
MNESLRLFNNVETNNKTIRITDILSYLSFSVGRVIQSCLNIKKNHFKLTIFDFLIFFNSKEILSWLWN